MDRPKEYLSNSDTPAGLALAMRQIRSDAANYLLRVKGFRRSQDWRALQHSNEDRALGRHSYFIVLANAFDVFIPPDRQTRKQRAAVRAIHHAYGVLSMLNRVAQAMPDRKGESFNWTPPTFSVLGEEPLRRVIGWSSSAFFWAGDFMLPSVSASAGGHTRALARGTAAEEDWPAWFLQEARKICGEGQRTQEELYCEVAAALAQRGITLPDFKKVQRRMTEWESADPPEYKRRCRPG